MKSLKGLIPGLALYSIVFFLIFPLFILIVWSFTNRWPWPYMFPGEFGIRGIVSLIQDGSQPLKVLLYSIWLSLCVTIITLTISIPAAKAIALYNFKGKRLVKMAVLAPIIVPSISVAMGIHLAFIKIGLVNTFPGVVLVHLVPCMPYGVRILTDVFEIIGDGMESQARILGANSFKVFFSITLPLIAPGLISSFILVFIVSFSQYFLTFLIGGGKVMTFSMIMFPFIQSGDRTMASSYSLVFIITTLIFLGVMEKMVKSYYRINNHFYV